VRLEVIEDTDVFLAPADSGLIDTDRGDLAEVLLGPGGIDVVMQDPLQRVVAHPQVVGDRLHRESGTQRHRQRLEGLAEPTIRAHPGHLDLSGLAAGATAHPRYVSMDTYPMLKEVPVLPALPPAVVDWLLRCLPSRATKARPALKGHLEVVLLVSSSKSIEVTSNGGWSPRAAVNKLF